MAKIDSIAMCIHGRHDELDKDARDKQKRWRRPTYSSWKRNEAMAKKFREDQGEKSPRELLYA